MKLERADYKNVKIEFTYSPLFEMLCSLHVLCYDAHHKYRLAWSEAVRGQMPKDLYNQLLFFSDLTGGFDSLMDYCDWSDEMHDFNVIKAIDYLESYSLKAFISMIFQGKLTEEEVHAIMVGKAKNLDQLRQSQLDFISQPKAMKEELISALKEYYYLFFQAEQMSIESYLIRTLKIHRSMSNKMDFLEYIDMLHPRIEVDNDKVTLHKYRTFNMYFKQLKRIEIRISSFIDPHLLVNMKSDYLMLCIRAKQEEAGDDIHDDLMTVLKSLSDKTRIRMVKFMYDQPKSTQELALMLDISEAAVSKHLKLLHKARVVNKMRKGNYVLYFLDAMTIDRLPMNIYQYLDE